MFGVLFMNESLLANVKVDLRITSYTKIWEGWGETDVTPEFNRFYYICDGEGIVIVDGVEYSPKAGDLMLLPAHKTISYGTINTNTYLKYWCHFDAKIGNTNLFDYIQLPYMVTIDDYTSIIHLFKSLISYSNHTDLASLLTIKASLLELIALYVKEGNKHNKTTTPVLHFDEKISYILYYIQKHLSNPLSVQLLAEKLNFHPNHFIRFFKHALGISPMKYICRQRVKQAEFLLLSSYLSISEVGERVGYPNVYHFSKAFKQYVGYSPSEYRQQFGQ